MPHPLARRQGLSHAGKRTTSPHPTTRRLVQPRALLPHAQALRHTGMSCAESSFVASPSPSGPSACGAVPAKVHTSSRKLTGKQQTAFGAWWLRHNASSNMPGVRWRGNNVGVERHLLLQHEMSSSFFRSAMKWPLLPLPPCLSLTLVAKSLVFDQDVSSISYAAAFVDMRKYAIEEHKHGLHAVSYLERKSMRC